MQRVIGIVVVHGIGNQAPGVLGRLIAGRLADAQNEAAGAPPAAGGNDREAGPEVRRITVGGVPVLVGEASWATLSHPDNPPRLEVATYLFRDFLDTVASAWRASVLGVALRRARTRSAVRRSLLIWAVPLLVLSAALLFVKPAEEDPRFTEAERRLSWTATLVPWYMAFLFYSARRFAVYRRVRARHAGRARRIREVGVGLAVGLFLSPFYFLVVILSVEILLFFSVLALLALAVNYVMLAPVWLLRGVGRLARPARLERLARWVHRLAWVTVILPTYALVQAAKASGNLLAIVLTEQGALVRATAAVGLVGAYLGFLALVLLCELWILPGVVPILAFAEEGWSWEGALATAFFWVVIYLPLLKLSLPAIDLLLDIGNYHLAVSEGRTPYGERIARLATRLVQAGCTELHVLAHSLGSVITYDWLRTAAASRFPVRALHTIGSPLEKFWYVDHPRTARVADREGLTQRISGTWRNYWAHSDPVSGALTRYGAAVSNERLRWLGLPLVSHVRYWTNPVVIEAVRRGIREAPASEP